jgi:hypothetical protein
MTPIAMFCNQCGAPLQPEFAACPKCGRTLTAALSPLSRLDRHLHTLAILWMIMGGLFLIPAAGVMIFARSIHVVIHRQSWGEGIFPLLLYIGGGTLLLLGAGGVCVGLGLTQRQPWARPTAIFLGFLALFHPPFGTALGVYTLWVLLADERRDQSRDSSRLTG